MLASYTLPSATAIACAKRQTAGLGESLISPGAATVFALMKYDLPHRSYCNCSYLFRSNLYCTCSSVLKKKTKQELCLLTLFGHGVLTDEWGEDVTRRPGNSPLSPCPAVWMSALLVLHGLNSLCL